MDRVWLEHELAAGRSIESIARAVGLHPTTVTYWMRKYGLISRHTDRHRARGALGADLLAELVDSHLSVREIAAETGRSPTTVRYWLAQYGLETTPRARGRARQSAARKGHCDRHGDVDLVANGAEMVCVRCRADRVSAWRRRAKRTLVEEAGGRCVLCGYDRCVAALQFHHRDPGQKRFGLGSRGLAQAIDRLREEARKCILLCANCHAEVEAGLATIPPAVPGSRPG